MRVRVPPGPLSCIVMPWNASACSGNTIAGTLCVSLFATRTCMLHRNLHRRRVSGAETAVAFVFRDETVPVPFSDPAIDFGPRPRISVAVFG